MMPIGKLNPSGSSSLDEPRSFLVREGRGPGDGRRSAVVVSPTPSPAGGGEEGGAGDARTTPIHEPLLLIWFSPAFPIGAFAYSHGLERAAEMGAVKDRSSLEAWLLDLLEHGALRNDLILLALAWQAASSGDVVRFVELAELAAAMQPSAERRFESVTQGEAFVTTIEAAWPAPAIAAWRNASACEWALPIAVAAAAAAHQVHLNPTLEAYALSFLSNLVSASIRLSVVGQTDGQRILASVLGDVRRACSILEQSGLDDLGTATFSADLASLEHETQYTRLFRT